MDTSLLIAAGASFVVGLTGYIIVRFWVKPIAAYTATKRKLRRELDLYLKNAYNRTESKKKVPKGGNPVLRNARRFTMKMAAQYSEDIPYWYRLLLESRGESPNDALGLITNLSKLRSQDEIEDRLHRARKKLGIP